MAMETVDFPTKNGGSFHRDVKLIEGTELKDGYFLQLLDSKNNGLWDFYPGTCMARLSKFPAILKDPVPAIPLIFYGVYKSWGLQSNIVTSNAFCVFFFDWFGGRIFGR